MKVFAAISFLLFLFIYSGSMVLVFTDETQEDVDIVILGDSHINYLSRTSGTTWGESMQSGKVKALGYDGYMSIHILEGQGKPLQSAIDLNPRKIVLLVGSNDVDRGISTDETMANIQKMYDRVKAHNIELFLITVPPATKIHDDEIGKGTFNERIVRLNRRIIQFCHKNNCDYFDLFTLLTSLNLKSDTALGEAFSLDGLHLSKKGYQSWIEEMKDAL